MTGGGVPVIRYDLVHYGRVTSIISPTVFISAGLAGFGNGAFAGATAPYSVFVFRDIGGLGAPPQGELQTITNYVSATGQITVAIAFTTPLQVGDEILVVHPSIANAVTGGGGTVTSTVVYTSATPPAAGTVYTTMLTIGVLKNLLFYVVNTSDVDITIQAIGNITNNPLTAVLLDGVVNVPALTGIETLGINLTGDDWHPFIGAQIIVPGGATIGNIVITAFTRN